MAQSTTSEISALALNKRILRIQQCVEKNDVEGFNLLMISRKECLNLRFNYNMNLL